jgi:hypothetical protein
MEGGKVLEVTLSLLGVSHTCPPHQPSPMPSCLSVARDFSHHPQPTTFILWLLQGMLESLSSISYSHGVMAPACGKYSAKPCTDIKALVEQGVKRSLGSDQHRLQVWLCLS